MPNTRVACRAIIAHPRDKAPVPCPNEATEIRRHGAPLMPLPVCTEHADVDARAWEWDTSPIQFEDYPLPLLQKLRGEFYALERVMKARIEQAQATLDASRYAGGTINEIIRRKYPDAPNEALEQLDAAIQDGLGKLFGDGQAAN